MKTKTAPKKRSELLQIAVEIVGQNEPISAEEFVEKLSDQLKFGNIVAAQKAVRAVSSAIDTLHLGYLDDDERLCLSPIGKHLYETKQPHPYADLLDGKPDTDLVVIEAALESLKDAPALTPCDPERAKALLKKILGEELYQYAHILDADEYHPVFGLGVIELHFCQGATPPDDFFAADPATVRSLSDIGIYAAVAAEELLEESE